MDVKTCTRCGETKAIDAFPFKRKDKRNSQCRNCCTKRMAEWRAKNPEKAQATRDAWYAANKDKHRVTVNAWIQRNLDRHKAYRKKYHIETKERLTPVRVQWRRDNPERSKEIDRRCKKKTAHAVNARTARYKAGKLRATPAWADEHKIRDKYELAQALTKQTKIPHEVDHIVPLVSKYVCGLHVEYNLQVIPASLNRSKSNKVWPNMPDGLPAQLQAHIYRAALQQGGNK